MKVTLTVTQGPAKGRTFDFCQPECVVFGKARDCRIVVEGDPQLSRQHFTLIVTPPLCRLRDHSSNGTYVRRKNALLRYGGSNPVPLGANAAENRSTEIDLQDGDEISAGVTRMIVRIRMICASCLVTIPENDRDAQVSPGRFVCSMCRATVGTFALESAPTVFQFAEPTPGGTDLPITLPQPKGLRLVVPQNAQRAAATTVLEDPPVVPPVLNAPEFKGYTISAVLGRGGMGLVFKAVQLGTGRPVAIKTILPSRTNGVTKMLKAFEREIAVQRQLKHPNIVELLGIERSGPLLGLVLELVDGMDLASYIQVRGGCVTLEEAAPIIKGVLAGLSHAHAAGVIHRDLKPENIFLTRDGGDGWTPKLADFGLAKKYEDSGRSIFDVAGTPPYWPREHIILYQSLYPASDVFSIAAVFYRMITGVHARAGMSEMVNGFTSMKRRPGFAEFSQLILHHPVVPIQKRGVPIPAPIAECLMKALWEGDLGPIETINKDDARAKLADMRYPNAGAFRDALSRAFKKAGL